MLILAFLSRAAAPGADGGLKKKNCDAFYFYGVSSWRALGAVLASLDFA